ncbi:hypothetical protein QYS36_10335 [Pseudomonas sp. G34]|uniref:hypothetical protein n=1 Tax=unclassified Pseudomonas TaxID=196821 RepID=UPI001782D512|nr:MULTISPECIES: hypothetical protein [unclassified Pseudomonas]MBD9655703.1 hypothetical protein [Pseudomonas sp. PDM12]MDQ7985333.1 hypothetical protein [Pseudomonas sp. G34]
MNSTSAEAIESIYEEARDFLIIGLTGRTGSGCSTAAAKLCAQSLDIPADGYEGLTNNELKKHKIIHKFLNNEKWHTFYKLEARSIITYHLLLLKQKQFYEYLKNTISDTTTEETIEQTYKDLISVREKLQILTPTKHTKKKATNQEWLDLYFERLPVATNIIKEHIGLAAFTKLYQSAGDNVRSSGAADDSRFNSEKLFNFPKHINKIIKIAHAASKEKNTPCRIVIDAIRNPYEAFFLKRRYANFYLLSINTPDTQRLNTLREARKLSSKEINDLDSKEYPEKISGEKKFIAQNIQACIEISDIHIHNSKKNEFNQNDLVSQLGWYLALMMHPGLVMPTSVENCMQVAYTVKQSSGCISRQVGAVVTDENYSIKSVGWNNTPQGQTPCLLRNAEDLLRGNNPSDYSDYEKNDNVFRKAISDKYIGLIQEGAKTRNIPFCFKSVQNEIEGEKNQVHTRALHAEENAFLQIAKNGGQKLSGGILLTTASPCELCAKKAYQLGITKVIYIDPYPGIATDHILSVGAKRPNLELFRGAVGRAFHQLYQPLMPYKDELDLIYSIKPYHNPSSPSKKFILEENKNLLDEVALLKEELRKLKADNQSQTQSK